MDDEIEIPAFNIPFIPAYMLIIEYENGEVELLKTIDSKGPIIAMEGNQSLLREMGDKLLGQNLIIGFQLVKTVSVPTRNY